MFPVNNNNNNNNENIHYLLFQFYLLFTFKKKIFFLCSLLRTICKDFKNKRKFIKITIYVKKKKLQHLKKLKFSDFLFLFY